MICYVKKSMMLIWPFLKLMNIICKKILSNKIIELKIEIVQKIHNARRGRQSLSKYLSYKVSK